MVSPIITAPYLASKLASAVSGFLIMAAGKALVKEPPTEILAPPDSPSYVTRNNTPNLGASLPVIYGMINYTPYLIARSMIIVQTQARASNTALVDTGFQTEQSTFRILYLIGRGDSSDFTVSRVCLGNMALSMGTVSLVNDFADSNIMENGVVFNENVPDFIPIPLRGNTLISPALANLRQIQIFGRPFPSNFPNSLIDANDIRLNAYPRHVITNTSVTALRLGVQWTGIYEEEAFRLTSFIQIRRTDQSAVSWTTVTPGLSSIALPQGTINRTLTFSFERDPTYDGTYEVRFIVPTVFYPAGFINAEDVLTEARTLTARGEIVSLAYGIPTGDLENDFTYLSFSYVSADYINFSSPNNLNVLIRRKLLTYHPDTGLSATRIATSNPAWVFMNLIEDANADEARINADRDNLFELSTFYATNNYSFDYVFDSPKTLADSLALVAAACNSSLISTKRGYTMLPDISRSTLNIVFHPGNISTNSLAIIDLVDESVPPGTIIATYVDNNTGESAQVSYVIPQSEYQRSSSNEVSKTVNMPGVTTASLAMRNARSLALSLLYRNCVIEFQCGFEGIIIDPEFNILLSHPLMNFNNEYGNGTVEFGSTITIRPYSTHGFANDATHEVVILNRNNQIIFQDVVSDLSSTDEITFSPTLNSSALPDGEYDFIIGRPGEVLSVCNIMSIAPSAIGLIVVRAVVDDPRAY